MSKVITMLGVTILLIYGISRMLEFYGVGINMYGSYVSFYVFILMSLFILPSR